MGAKIPFGAMKILSSSAAAGDVQGCECTNVTNGKFCFVFFTEKNNKTDNGTEQFKIKIHMHTWRAFYNIKKNRK